jgi:hypothetical protein
VHRFPIIGYISIVDYFLAICAKLRPFIKKHTYHFGIFSLAIPSTSASIERAFSITNALWTDEKNSFLVETIKAVIVTKTHLQDL